MGLAHPALSTLGKKKGKKKYASAEAKRRALELEAEWEKLKASHKSPKTTRKPLKNWTYSLSSGSRDTGPRYDSKGDSMGVATAKETQQYTGDQMVGIATMSKSNAIPIFNQDHAIDVARMRR